MTIPSFRENFVPLPVVFPAISAPTGICVYEPPVRLMKLHVQIVSGSQKNAIITLSWGITHLQFFKWACLRGTGSYVHTCGAGVPSCCMWETGGPNRKRSHAQRPLAHKPSTALEEEGNSFIHTLLH